MGAMKCRGLRCVDLSYVRLVTYVRIVYMTYLIKCRLEVLSCELATFVAFTQSLRNMRP